MEQQVVNYEAIVSTLREDKEEMEEELILLRQNKKENDYWVDNQQSLID